MAYEPTEWKSGDVVTSAKLNKIEGGISSGGVLVITADPDTDTLDHTWQDIHDAALPVMVSSDDEEKSWYLCSVYVEDSEYYVAVYDFANSQNWLYKTDAASGYPVYYDPDAQPLELNKSLNGGGSHDNA